MGNVEGTIAKLLVVALGNFVPVGVVTISVQT